MFNRELASRAASLVAARKSRLELDRDVSAKLLYPLKRRSDAAQYQSLTRRPLVPATAIGSPRPARIRAGRRRLRGRPEGLAALAQRPGAQPVADRPLTRSRSGSSCSSA